MMKNMNIPNYEIIEKLAESKETVIYKAYHKKIRNACWF